MSNVYPIPAKMEEDQRLAADPGLSAWVSANAGSGKTHVLSRRVIRLLLAGTDPARILCLTYTRAAAAQMSNRVFDELAKWTAMDDAELVAAISKLDGGENPGEAMMARARRLFARALETPGGLKIQTIHAFCESVLHQFPLEANIAGRFELADQAATDALLGEARRQVLTAAGKNENPRLASALAAVLFHGAEDGLEKLLGEAIARRDEIIAFARQMNGHKTEDLLRQEFRFGHDETPSGIAALAFPFPGLDADYVRALLDRARSAGTKTAENFAQGFLSACEVNDPFAMLDALRVVFLTKKDEPKDSKNLAAAKIVPEFPDIAERFDKSAAHLLAVIDRTNLLRMIEATSAALTVAGAVIERYQHLKTARGLLDFNDLISRTVHLLARRDAGPWVQFKLDKGIDHILVDEAQDTSPPQWAVIRMLADEFFAGEGARAAGRTIFAVGDEKQSIYSFQGAEPEAFAECRTEFASRARNAGLRFEPVGLRHSFRSAPDVLSAVDLVFGDEEAKSGLTRDPQKIFHEAIRENDPGFVELWGSIGEEAVEEVPDWRQSVDHATAASVRLAAVIAKKIRNWLKGERLPSGGAPVRPGDIIVLVRKRDRFMHALSRALKDMRVPVAGADRIRLRDHIAVKDMVALGRIVLQPDDDLSLAALLKSPVFGLDDDALMALAIGRPAGQSLLEAVKRDGGHTSIVERLGEWSRLAGRTPPFEFFARLLGHGGIRRAMVARLGNEAGDMLDEFLNFSLACERNGINGLEAFLATLDTKSPEIRRESESGRDEIRIMTVHAAKGLEARVVFLVDSGGEPVSSSHLPNILRFEPERKFWRGPGFLWCPSKSVSNNVSESLKSALKQKAGEEYRRLLYVGMTRAKDGLIVCGYHGTRGKRADTWHAMVERALAGKSEQFEDTTTGLPVWRYRLTEDMRAPAGKTGTPSRPAGSIVPEYLTVPPAPLPAMPRPLAPSGVSSVIETGTEYGGLTESPVLAADDKPSRAQQRGTAIHRLLEKLPGMAKEGREAVAMRYLDFALPGWSGAERREILDSVAAVLEDLRFAPVFGRGSRAEIAVMGTLSIGGIERAISGKIDRIATNDDAVLIVDYKTNRPPPHDYSAIPAGYIAQMALYRALVAPLYPGRAVRAGLLFTETPRLFELTEETLGSALARLTQA